MVCPEYSIGTVNEEGTNLKIDSGEWAGTVFKLAPPVLYEDDVSLPLIAIDSPTEVDYSDLPSTLVEDIKLVSNDYFKFIVENKIYKIKE